MQFGIYKGVINNYVDIVLPFSGLPTLPTSEQRSN